MSERNYQAELEQLVNGELEKIEVEQPEFLFFREAWLAQANRKQIVGEAGLNGKIIYRFQENS